MCITLRILGFWNLSTPFSKNETEYWGVMCSHEMKGLGTTVIELELAEWVSLHPLPCKWNWIQFVKHLEY